MLRRSKLHEGTALLTRPQDAVRLVRQTVLAQASPLELELPWMSYAVIDFLDRWITDRTVVLECGAGGSTLFFARRAGRVVSVESDPAWSAAVRARLDAKGLDNVDLRSAEADFADPDALPDSPFFRALGDEPADLVLIDSFDHVTHRCRPILFHRGEELVRPGGIVVVDDAWRYEHLRDEHRARAVERFRGLGPGSRRLRTTDVYRY